MRSYMFTGFLTLGGLLYSLKTFIIIKMHENIYAQNWYIERVKEKKTSNPKMSFYGPLKRLSSFLYISILLALLTSFAQFTIGLIDHWLAALLCCYIAASCLLLFIFSFIIIKSNLDFWLDELEKKASDLENNTPKVSNIS